MERRPSLLFLTGTTLLAAVFAGLSAKLQDENLRLHRELAELRTDVAEVRRELATVTAVHTASQVMPTAKIGAWDRTRSRLILSSPDPDPISTLITNYTAQKTEVDYLWYSAPIGSRTGPTRLPFTNTTGFNVPSHILAFRPLESIHFCPGIPNALFAGIPSSAFIKPIQPPRDLNAMISELIEPVEPIVESLALDLFKYGH